MESSSGFIKGTHHISKAGYEVEYIRSLIQRRRLQILVHSCLYYKLATSIVSDEVWQEWADELVQLQKDYPKMSRHIDYYEDFKGFDGSTGFHLPFGSWEVLTKAYQILVYQEGLNGRGTGN